MRNWPQVLRCSSRNSGPCYTSGTKTLAEWLRQLGWSVPLLPAAVMKREIIPPSFLLHSSEKMGMCGSSCFVTSQSRRSCVGSCRRQLSSALVHKQGCHTAVLAEGKSKVMGFLYLHCLSNPRTALKSREASVAFLDRVKLFVGFGMWAWFFWSVWFLGYFLWAGSHKVAVDKHAWQVLMFCFNECLPSVRMKSTAQAVSVKWKEEQRHVGNKSKRARAVPCPSRCPCPKQIKAPGWLMALCLSRFCQPKRKSHGDPEEPGGPCEGAGTCPVSHGWVGLCAPANTQWHCRCLQPDWGRKKRGTTTPVPCSVSQPQLWAQLNLREVGATFLTMGTNSRPAVQAVSFWKGRDKLQTMAKPRWQNNCRAQHV